LDFPDSPDDSAEALSVSCTVETRAIKAGSSGGLDHLRPQNFKKLISKATGVCFLKSLTSLVVPFCFSTILFWDQACDL